MYVPLFTTTARVARLLEEIAAIRERIRVSLLRVPWVPSLVSDAMARMAWGSTAIEGCTLSVEAIRGLLEGKESTGYPRQHVRMAQNYLEALAWIQKREKSREIKEKELFELHRMIGEGAIDEGPVGAYRRIDVRAGLHVAPSWRKVPKLTREMLEWLKGPAEELPAIFSSAILHLRFVEIHPFRDGNGRLARALATWELYRKGFDTLHIFALDEILQEDRAFYIKNLQRVQVEGEDLGGWIEFIAEAVFETLERVDKKIQAYGPLAKEPLSLTVRQEKLLRVLREKGQAGVQELVRSLKLTSPGVHYALRPLLHAGIVERMGAHKNTRYRLASK